MLDHSQYDDAWANDPRFVKFDFNDAECIPENLRNTFDMVVIDPPFITRSVMFSLCLHIDETATPHVVITIVLHRDVWDKYAAHVYKLLHKPTATVPHISPFPDSPLKDTFHGLCLVTSIAENADMLHELLGVKRVAFQPSIPNLIYQYDMYTNFPVKHTDTVNSEINW